MTRMATKRASCNARSCIGELQIKPHEQGRGQSAAAIYPTHERSSSTTRHMYTKDISLPPI
jgi:hypothetical protein